MTFFPGLNHLVERGHLARWQSQVSRINDASNEYKSLSDDQLRKTSLSMRYEARSGRPLNDLVTESFALVREAGRRALGMRHYDVQVLGGLAMHHGSIAVMQTGEGKTLTATLPMYLAALTGDGAHLATANDYLAERDADLMRPLYEALGLTVGVVINGMDRPSRQASYACDVTYSTAKEIGFDFLRDRLFQRQQLTSAPVLVRGLVGGTATDSSHRSVQRGMNFMLVDEADSILIDEARTPLIVSSAPDEVVKAKIALYRWAHQHVAHFIEDEHYEDDKKTKLVTLTAEGRRKARKINKPELLNRTPILEIYEQMEQAIHVEKNYIRDRHYVVREGEVVIVDEFTGRLSEGRKWRSGLHQAIEAREGLEISIETGEAARITIQDLFLRYDRLAGMTGTAANSAAELRSIYGVHVVDVPTNKPPQRKRLPDLVFATEDEKWIAIADEVAEVNQTGRPILIGTRSIDKSERLAKLLDQRGIAYDILNARHLENEANIVASAGSVSRVTVATNMAGRGTDIKISGPSLDLGGLHVICTEMHESARIDRQLIGRCGRQGDPGTFRQYLSLEDDLLKVGFGETTVGKFEAYKDQSHKALARFSKHFIAAQRKIERRHFRSRKLLLHHEKTRQQMQKEMGQDPYLDTAGA